MAPHPHTTRTIKNKTKNQIKPKHSHIYKPKYLQLSTKKKINGKEKKVGPIIPGWKLIVPKL